jgi:hypothetical protein
MRVLAVEYWRQIEESGENRAYQVVKKVEDLSKGKKT